MDGIQPVFLMIKKKEGAVRNNYQNRLCWGLWDLEVQNPRLMGIVVRRGVWRV